MGKLLALADCHLTGEVWARTNFKVHAHTRPVGCAHMSLLTFRRQYLTALMCMAVGGTATAQTAPTAPAQTTQVAPTPAKPAPIKPASGATAKSASAIAIEVSAAVKGQMVTCPAALKLSPRAVCLYVKNSAATLRPAILGKLGNRAVGEWKTTGKSSTLLVTEALGGPVSAFVLLSNLAEQESLVAVDALQAKAVTPTKVTLPTGAVKGQPYVLDKDLIGVITAISLGAGKYRLTSDGNTTLTVTVGQKKAQVAAGTVELPLAPVTDGKNLIFPLSGLSALGCTVSAATSGVTVACGKNSVGLKPIVF